MNSLNSSGALAAKRSSVAEHLQDAIIVGKDILELVSTSMYVDPLTIFREYVQNAADAIDEAKSEGLYTPRNPAKVDILLDLQRRSVVIRDNGAGIRRDKLARTLTSFGASKKRGTNARGFRGIGRLSGLAYCKRLVFRTRHHSDRAVSEITWDCEQLRALLRDPEYKGSLDDLVRRIVTLKAVDDESGRPAHFFEVELQEVPRIKSDVLLNEEAVYQYLSQVGPVPFAPDFSLGKQITAYLGKFGIGTAYDIFINGRETPVYRPFQDSFDARLGVIDRFVDLETMEIDGAADGTAAVGWILQHGYEGALPTGLGVKGIRLRKGNIQIGDNAILDEAFQEPRFNSWCVAEFHAVSPNLVPNGRRDSFDQNRHLQDLVSKLRPLAAKLSKLCRQKSQERHSVAREKKPACVSPKQEKLLCELPPRKQTTLREVATLLYHIKGSDADGLVTSLLEALARKKAS